LSDGHCFGDAAVGQQQFWDKRVQALGKQIPFKSLALKPVGILHDPMATSGFQTGATLENVIIVQSKLKLRVE
jgi:hypothetical protein